MIQRITIIGAGNLATHLSVELKRAGYEILQVYSRTEKSAKELAAKLESDFTNSINKISKEADLYIVALKDSAVLEVLSKIDFQNKPLIHCSGSLPLSILKSYSENIGVLYPLQTFSKNRKVNFKEIPVFVEANNQETEKLLIKLASSISPKVSVLSSDKRKSLHIAAVFACNFVNHFYTLAGDFLQTEDIAFEVLYPLISETAKKVQEMNPADAQTGPAVRFDENIINDHLKQLNNFPDHQEVYKSISKSIFKRHQEKNK
ncbi:DUF2520 domain-containing protein [Prolixibacteraceae bacterium Z1-6]|uniref:DUF2520 domain-containing protein n=1 Tax=Draconibacterium aestuarii TaxID=2998507 RepID=A0A9X3J8U2_9BACT|nr:DUF2520 domain-containing protein [Prolixibacteraceae bacterium Z1-6]